jgi:type II secretory ATPase GspE/PulE/Tfp pilus assembly ATPase PilB-like protein
MDTIIADAYLKGATGIRFDSSTSPGESNVLFQMNGVMREYMTIPVAEADNMVKRIKLMANLDVEDLCLPKIGHIKFKHDGLPEFRIKVTTSPNDGLMETATLMIQST